MQSSSRESLLAGLSAVLWEERHSLEILLFKLVEEQLVLHCADPRWLARATEEVELASEQVRLVELGRAVEVHALTRALGIDGRATLRALAGQVDDPWPGILTGHREAFLCLTGEIAEAASRTRGLVRHARGLGEGGVASGDQAPGSLRRGRRPATEAAEAATVPDPAGRP